MQKKLLSFFIAVMGLTAASMRVEAHAFLLRAEPRVGSKVNKAPAEVRVRFSETVQGNASSLTVFDANGKQVDKKNTHPDPANRAVLSVSLMPALTPGLYKVVWRATSMDTHVTQGNFHFQIAP